MNASGLCRRWNASTRRRTFFSPFTSAPSCWKGYPPRPGRTARPRPAACEGLPNRYHPACHADGHLVRRKRDARVPAYDAGPQALARSRGAARATARDGVLRSARVHLLRARSRFQDRAHRRVRADASERVGRRRGRHGSGHEHRRPHRALPRSHGGHVLRHLLGRSLGYRPARAPGVPRGSRRNRDADDGPAPVAVRNDRVRRRPARLAVPREAGSRGSLDQRRILRIRPGRLRALGRGGPGA